MAKLMCSCLKLVLFSQDYKSEIWAPGSWIAVLKFGAGRGG